MNRLLPRPISFRVQLAIVFGAIVVALAAAMSLVIGQRLSETMRAQAGKSLHLVASNAARVLGDDLRDRLGLVQGLAESDALWEHGLGSEEVRRSLAQQQSTRANLAWLGVADKNGRVEAASGGLLVGANVAARPWFAAGLAGPHIGDLHAALLLARLLPAARNGEPQRFVDFSAPIRRNGQVVGVVAIHGGWDWARNVIESLLPTDAKRSSLEVFIFDRSGALIYAPSDTAAPHLQAGQRLPALAGASAAHGSASVVRWGDGAQYLTAEAPLRPQDASIDLGWHVVARMPADLALGAARRAVESVLWTGGLAGLVAASIAWLVAGSISGPLSAIASAARRLQLGETDARIPTGGSSRELVDLGDALSAMTQRLLASNEELERRVAARTTELERANTELDRLARFDPLTEVYNRRGFEEQMKIAIASALRRKAPLSLIMVDADHFKRVNDTHGHDVGDQVLKALTLAMRERLRASDLVGRLGGEEFAALLPDTDLAGARQVADELVTRIASTWRPLVGHITISCGVAAVLAGDDGSAALRSADRALYRAKAEGRNRSAVEAAGPALAAVG